MGVNTLLPLEARPAEAALAGVAGGQVQDRMHKFIVVHVEDEGTAATWHKVGHSYAPQLLFFAGEGACAQPSVPVVCPL